MSYNYTNEFNTLDESSIGYLFSGDTINNSSFYFNSALQSVDLTGAGGTGLFWSLTGLPIFDSNYDATFEAELEFVSDSSSRKHLGITLVKDVNDVTGLRFAHLDNSWQLARINSIRSGSVISYTQQANPTFNVGEKKVIKFLKHQDNIKFFVNDVLVCDITDSSYRLLRPGIYIYGGISRVHRVTYQINGFDIGFNELRNNFAWANNETKQQAWPGENSYKQLDSQTAEKVYGITTSAMLNAPPLRKDFGFIEGVITRKTAPAVGQHVICLDDRFNLVAETFSGAGGHYRFDSLPINGLYAIHAYDNNEYKYAPVGADRRTPEAYP